MSEEDLIQYDDEADKSSSLWPVHYWTLTILITAIVGLLVWAGVSYYIEQPNPPRTVTVYGAAKMMIPARMTHMNVTVIARGNNTLKANLALDAAVRKTQLALSTWGISDKAITYSVTDISSAKNPALDADASDAVAYYTLSQTITVVYEGKAMSDAGQHAQLLRTLSSEGVELGKIEVVYKGSISEAEKAKLLEQAMADGRIAADAIAQKAGSEIGKVMAVDPRFSQVMSPNSPESIVDGLSETDTMIKSARLAVKITYSLK